jgi:hypothetical protein
VRESTHLRDTRVFHHRFVRVRVCLDSVEGEGKSLCHVLSFFRTNRCEIFGNSARFRNDYMIECAWLRAGRAR